MLPLYTLSQHPLSICLCQLLHQQVETEVEPENWEELGDDEPSETGLSGFRKKTQLFIHVYSHSRNKLGGATPHSNAQEVLCMKDPPSGLPDSVTWLQLPELLKLEKRAGDADVVQALWPCPGNVALGARHGGWTLVQSMEKCRVDFLSWNMLKQSMAYQNLRDLAWPLQKKSCFHHFHLGFLSVSFSQSFRERSDRSERQCGPRA